MPAGAIVFIAAIFVVVIIGIVASFKAAKKRRLAMETWANGHGWHFTPDNVSSFEKRFAHLGCFTQGDTRYGYNIVRGERNECDLWALDYHYQTYSTDSKGNRQTHHHHFSAVVIDTGMVMKSLSLRKEGIFDKMKSAFGFDDIDFESAEFSKKFWVTAKEKRWAYDVINQRNMELLLKSPRFSLQFEGSHVVAWRSTRFKPPEFDQALKLVFGVLEGIPKDIRQRLST